MKDMFYTGMPNGGDGRCANCPYLTKETIAGDICSETGADVEAYESNGRVNKNCPFITK